MFYVLENVNFKLDPKYSFYRRRRHSSQRAVTVQRVDNAQLEKLSPFSYASTSDKSQEGASSSPCSELAAGQEAKPGVPSILQDGEGSPGSQTQDSLSCTVAFAPARTGVCL